MGTGFGRKKRRKRKAVFWDDERIRGILLLTVFVWIFARINIVRRCGIEGSAFYYGAFDLYLFFMLLYPVPLSEMVNEAVKRRKETENFRNSKRILNFGVVSVFIYSMLVWLIMGVASEGIANLMLLGRGEKLPLQIFAFMIPFDAFMLLIGGYDAALKDRTHRSIALLFRGLSTLVLSFIFSGYFQEKGKSVSRFLGSEVPGYAYKASGAAIGVAVSSLASVVVMFMLYLTVRESFERRIHTDKSSRIEDGYTILGSVGETGFAFLSFFSTDILLWLVYRRAMAGGSGELLMPYHMGIYHGIMMTLVILPAALVYVTLRPELNSLTPAIKGGYIHDVAVECKAYTKAAMLVAFGFAAVYFALSPVISTGVFGCDSKLAERCIELGAVMIPLMMYALVSSMYLVITKKYMTLAMHALAAAIPSLILGYILISPAKLNLLGAVIAFMLSLLILSFFNHMILGRYLKLRFDLRDFVIVPLAAGLLSLVICFVLRLLFSLFLPPLICFIPLFVLGLFIYFIFICVGGAVDPHRLITLPAGRFLYSIVHRMRIL